MASLILELGRADRRLGRVASRLFRPFRKLLVTTTAM